MLLTVNDMLTFPPAAGEALEIDRVALGGDPPFKAEATVSTGYTDVTSVANWDLHGQATSGYSVFRQVLLDDFIGDWGTLTTDEQKTLVRHHVWPIGTTDTELDTLWTAAERAAFLAKVTSTQLSEEQKDIGMSPHVGARYPVMAQAKVIEGTKPITQDSTWQHLGGVSGDLSKSAVVLANAFGRLSGDYKSVKGAGNEKAQFRIREDDGTSIVTLVTSDIPDTSDAWKREAELDTTTVMRLGRNRYTLEGRLNGAVSASLRDGIFALIEKFG